MNRYWLFQECDYEAWGGLNDLKGTFGTIKAAKAYVEVNPWGDFSYVVDSKTWKTVCSVGHDLSTKIFKWEKVNERSYDIGVPKSKDKK